jgi:hypothetical protein
MLKVTFLAGIILKSTHLAGIMMNRTIGVKFRLSFVYLLLKLDLFLERQHKHFGDFGMAHCCHPVANSESKLLTRNE